jgi:hypothetical protein
LTNGDFEQGATGWGGVFSTTPATASSFCSGPTSIALVANKSISQSVSATAGKTYVLKVRGDVFQMTSMSGRVGFRFKNGATVLDETFAVYNSSLPGVVWETFPLVASGLCGYRDITLSKIAPAGTTSVEVLGEHLGQFLPTALTELKFDAFCLTESSGSNCAISHIIGTNVACQNNGTPNIATDDTYSFTMTILNSGSCGTGWTGGIAPFTTGNYNIAFGMGNYPISGGNTTLTIKDNVNPAITTLVTVVAPPTCSANVSPKPDLELSLTAAPQSPGQWKNTVLTLTLKNTGTVAATNVAVDFVNQSNVLVSNMLAYVSHVLPASTTFNSWTGFWNVGTVAAGQTLVLTYTGFTKVATQIPVFSQVKTASPADADSAPGNNTTGNPTEDDEAKVVINVNFLAQGEREEDEEKTFFQKMSFLEDYTLFPNPAGESVSILLSEKVTQSHSNTTPSTITFLNQLGKRVYQKTFDSSVLENRVLQVDLSDFSNGLYFVKLETEGQRAVVKRLIVSRMY